MSIHCKRCAKEKEPKRLHSQFCASCNSQGWEGPKSDIRWFRAIAPFGCHECEETVETGERGAEHIDRGKFGAGSKRFTFRRFYCEGCATDLESSLVTTGD